MNELKRITTPFNYTKSIEKMMYEREESKIIISCMNKKKNFCNTTKLPKWNETYLASLSWRNSSKSIGDHFTINPFSKLPAWLNIKLRFEEMGLRSKLITAVNNISIQQPTNIQCMTIPVISGGYNTIIGGETGGGKTLAFVLPILNRFLNTEQNTEDIVSPSSLIIAPTWELCTQIKNVIASIGEPLSIKSVLFKYPEDLQGKIDLLVSTPHNMLDAITSEAVKLRNLTSIVMDEADMLLDNSFSALTQNIMSKISIQTGLPLDGSPVGCQVILCNATSPKDLDATFGQFVPMDSFSVLHNQDMQRLIPCVSHKFMRCTKDQKPAILLSILKNKGINSGPYTIVFCNTIESVSNLSLLLTENGVEHSALCKNISMNERITNFENFQNGKVRVLLATDLGARGLDTVKARQIINYEFPRFISDYIHRAGRTGRVGNGDGKVINLISHCREVAAVQYIETSVRLNRKLMDMDAKMITYQGSDTAY